MNSYLRKTNLLVVLIVNSFIGFSQSSTLNFIPYDKNQKIQIKLLDKEIIATDRGFELRLSIENKTDSSFILYNFMLFRNGRKDETFFTNNSIGAGPDLFPKDKNNRWFGLELDSKLDRRMKYDLPFTRASIDSIYDKSYITIKGRETLQIKVPIKLRQGFLKKGVYSLFIVYYSGVNIPNIIDEEKILADMKKHNAIVYQGYIKSNTVKFKVIKTHPPEKLIDHLKHD